MYSYDDLLAGFRSVELTPSKVLMIHSSYKALGGVDGGAERLIDALLDFVGPEGTLLFPNFNFQSWTESHYFDIRETPSKMGIIGELARLRDKAVRTPHPIYSFAVLGKRKMDFAVCDDMEAYGPNSVFALFHELNGTIVSIGLHWNSTFSMHHYVEYRTGCDYRRIKRFAGIYVDYEGIPQIKTYTMFVRKNFRIITDIVEGMDELLESGVIRETRVGDAKVHYASANDFFDHMSIIVRTHPEKLHKVKPPKY
ncbi:MAG: AAC(3) family N-acetyltransferase [Anaerolineales bacterium]|jgi:aminoglycoside 3-N-acetyltransferase